MNNMESLHGKVIQHLGIKYRTIEDGISEACENCVFFDITKVNDCKMWSDERFSCIDGYHFVKVKTKKEN